MRDAVLVLLLAAAVLLPFAWARDLFDADEGRYATVALEMNRTGDLVVPHLNGMPFMDKPPLVYWIQAVLTQMFGSSEMVARAPTLLAGCFWVLFVFLFARDWSGSRRAAWLAAAMAATSAAGIIGSRVGPQMDMPLAACVAGALYASWRGLRGSRFVPALGLGLAVGLGLLTKGPLVAAVPFLVGVAWMFCGVRPKRVLRMMFSPVAWGVALLIAAPWYVLVERAQPGWIQHFVFYEHFGRFGEGDHRNFHPFWFYVPIVLLYLVPWTPLAWALGTGSVYKRAVGLVLGSPWFPRPWRSALDMHYPVGRRQGVVATWTLAWTWFLVAFLLYSASTRKLLNYLLPAAAPLFVLVGARLDLFLRQERRLQCMLPVTLGIGAVAIGVLILAGAFFPLATGNLPRATELPRWAPLAPWWIGAGAVLLLFVVTAMRRTRSQVQTAVLLITGAAVFWWGADLGLARVSAIGSARQLAEALKTEADAGAIPVCLKRYPQGIRFYAEQYVWIAGGTPEDWWQREIVNPYARRAWEARREREQRLEPPHPVWEGRGNLLTSEEFDALWKSGRRVALVCRWREIPFLAAEIVAGPFGGAGRTDLYLVTNQHPYVPPR